MSLTVKLLFVSALVAVISSAPSTEKTPSSTGSGYRTYGNGVPAANSAPQTYQSNRQVRDTSSTTEKLSSDYRNPHLLAQNSTEHERHQRDVSGASTPRYQVNRAHGLNPDEVSTQQKQRPATLEAKVPQTNQRQVRDTSSTSARPVLNTQQKQQRPTFDRPRNSRDTKDQKDNKQHVVIPPPQVGHKDEHHASPAAHVERKSRDTHRADKTTLPLQKPVKQTRPSPGYQKPAGRNTRDTNDRSGANQQKAPLPLATSAQNSKHGALNAQQTHHTSSGQH